MKAVVIYESKTGFSKRYAEWIAGELAADLFEASRFNTKSFDGYDTVVYGGGLYPSGINGIRLIKGNLEKLRGKRVIVFASGATPTKEETIAQIRNYNFTPEQLNTIKFFYLRGGFQPKGLKPVDKTLLFFLKLGLRMKKQPTHEEKGLLAVFDRPVDFTSKEHVKEVVKAAKHR